MPALTRPRDAAIRIYKAGLRSPSNATRGVLLLGYTLLAACRLPEILLKGRFWAEEGNKFLVLAWSLPWWHALLSPWGGYLNITANLGGLLAWHAVPLNDAPYATSLLALAVQLIPAILLLTSRQDWLDRTPVLLAALLMVLAVPSSDEIWLSSIGSQVHLSLCAGLILALDLRGGATGVFRLAVLLLAGLSGPGPWLLTPLFAVRAVLERSRRRAAQAAALGVAVFLQVAFFYSHVAERAYAIRPLMFLDLAYNKHVLLALLGPVGIERAVERMQALVSAGHPPWRDAIVMLAIGVVTLAAFAQRWRHASLWLLLAAMTLAGVADIGVLRDASVMFNVNGAGRYVYAPQVLIDLAVLGCAASRRDIAGWVCVPIAAWLLTTGMIWYFIPGETIFADGPGWRTELAHHRRDPGYKVRSWPPTWNVRLPDDPPVRN